MRFSRVLARGVSSSIRAREMAARAQSFVCQNCGAAFPRWAGKCEACGEWNTLVEEGAEGGRRASRKGRLFAVEPLKGTAHEAPRLASGIGEFDRVTGGGLVRGSVLLLGGDPGIGKSTLLLDVAAAFARARHRAVYISGEEATAQERLRADRLCGAGAPGGGAGRTSARSRHRFYPDHADAKCRSGSGDGDAGSRLRR